MLEQWVPFAVVSFIVLLSFLTNVAFGSKVADWTNSAPIEINSPWKRPGAWITGRAGAGSPAVKDEPKTSAVSR
jgi:hypothetical protein